LQPDGKILIGGSFTKVNGTSRNGIARLNSGGTLDTTFNPGTGISVASTSNVPIVYAIARQADGKIVIGGIFSYFNGTARYGIARLNSGGTLDTTFNPGTSITYGIQSIVLQSDGKMLVGGSIDYNGTYYGIGRLNTNGAWDTTFSPPSAKVTVSSISISPSDGKIMIGGNLTTLNGEYLARLTPDGLLDTNFNNADGTDRNVYSVSRQSNGYLIVGGAFEIINGVQKPSIARLTFDGSLDGSFRAYTDGIVRSTLIQSDGKIVIGGDFSSVNGTAHSNIARLDTNGALDTAFIGTGTDSGIQSMMLQTDSKIVIGGDFTKVNNITRKNIARLNTDGSLDTSFNAVTLVWSSTPKIWALARQSDGKIIIGGQFSKVNTALRNGVARLNTNGSLDTSFVPAIDTGSEIVSIAIQSDGKIVVGGFPSAGNGAIQGIVRLNTDGSLDTSFNSGADANVLIWSIIYQTDGKLIVGGEFGSINGQPVAGLARLNTDGSLDTTFNGGVDSGYISAMTAQPDGKIVIGGWFSSINAN